MKNQIKLISNIQKQIHTIRGVQVMLDSDLAQLYDVETKNLNRAVSRNIERFPEKYRFQITKEEWESLQFQLTNSGKSSLRFQNGTLKEGRGKHRKYLPYVFTEQGVAMLSAVLHSETAVKVSIRIIDAFVEMKKFITVNAGVFQRLDKVEQKQLETDRKFDQIFKALEDKSIKPKQGIFYDGQAFDAYVFIADLIKTAQKWVAFSKMDLQAVEMITNLKNGGGDE